MLHTCKLSKLYVLISVKRYCVETAAWPFHPILLKWDILVLFSVSPLGLSGFGSLSWEREREIQRRVIQGGDIWKWKKNHILSPACRTLSLLYSRRQFFLFFFLMSLFLKNTDLTASHRSLAVNCHFWCNNRLQNQFILILLAVIRSNKISYIIVSSNEVSHCCAAVFRGWFSSLFIS
jgi:hypothetical protein